MILGMRYSPVSGSLASSISMTPRLFMLEFQDMLAMYMKSTSTG